MKTKSFGAYVKKRFNKKEQAQLKKEVKQEVKLLLNNIMFFTTARNRRTVNS